jgi:predicted metal-dependent phosphoesterase TrpH
MNLKSKADLHIHSNFSDGQNSPQEIVDEAIKRGLAIIAITDHNQIEGAQIAQRYAQRNKLPLEVIVGEEVYTQDGEVIGLFLKTWITPHQTAQKTCQEIKKQGGLTFAPHPASIIGGVGLNHRQIKKLAQKKLLDAIELHNGGDLVRIDRHLTKYQNTLPLLAQIGGSDAHQIQDIGSCYTLFPGKNQKDLKLAIQKNLTQAKQKAGFQDPQHVLNYFQRGFVRILKKENHYSHKSPLSFKIRVILKQIHQKYWQTK